MKKHPAPAVIAAGLAGGFLGNGILGALFTSPPIHALLYDPRWQSQLFLEITPKRNVPVSVAGLVALGIVSSWLFHVFAPSIPGRSWLRKGLFWGLTLWSMYWLPQEWFVYHTLLGEPYLLNVLELAILLLGACVQGIAIAFLLRPGEPSPAGTSRRPER